MSRDLDRAVLLRKQLGVSQVEMARRLKMTQGALSKLEQRGDYIPVLHLRRYLNALGYSLTITMVPQ